jgi:hypothetical protein
VGGIHEDGDTVFGREVMMTASERRIELEERISALESQVERLRQRLDEGIGDAGPWWKGLVGAFAEDPDFEEAMRLGKQHRESLVIALA